MKKLTKYLVSLFILLGCLMSHSLFTSPTAHAEALDCDKVVGLIPRDKCEFYNANGYECLVKPGYAACKKAGQCDRYSDGVVHLNPEYSAQIQQEVFVDFCNAPDGSTTNNNDTDTDTNTDNNTTNDPNSPGTTGTNDTNDTDSTSGTTSDKNTTKNNKSEDPTVFEGNCDSTFLGLTSWHCGVKISDEESLKTGIWKIVTNISIDITIIAAYLVIGYVIYGGYMYMMSEGDPNKVATGKKTLTQAFIGLAIVMSAYVIMNAIRFALLGSSGQLVGCASNVCVDANSLVTGAIQWAIGIAGLVALIFVVYGGITYSMSSGDPTKLQKAKNAILYALIGLAIVALAEIITAFVSSTIRNANGAAFTNETKISKEVYDYEKTN